MTKTHVIIFLSILCLFFWRKNSEERIITERVTDTITVVRKDTIYVTAPPVKIVVEKPVYISVAQPIKDGKDSLRVYADTVYADSIAIHYNATVSGYLEGISIGISGKYKTDVTTVTNTITNTNYISQNGLYIGVSVSNKTSLIGGSYVFGKNMVSVDYGLNNSIMIGYRRKILGGKSVRAN